MKLRIRKTVTALFGAAAVSALLSLGATTASAQPIGWNPPCTTTKIVNSTGCTANLTIATNVGNIFVSVPPGGSGPVVFPAGSTVNGVFTQAGTFVPLVSPGPIIPNPPGPGTPSAGWVSGVILGPPPGCCFDVYFEQPPGGNCYIWLQPGTPPCIP